MTEIERELRAIRNEMRRLTGELPMLLTFKQAARELSFSVSKVKQMVRAGVLQTVRPDPTGHPRIPAGEVTRVASVSPDTVSKRDKVARAAKRPTHTQGAGSATRQKVREAIRAGRFKRS